MSSGLDLKKFRRGSICRIRMKNFLTFDDCVVYPGPKLNLVIGPNGTGKSSITHAMCLACCGDAGDIGRANETSKFIKHGTDNDEPCFVEVDIVDSPESGKVITIRRTLKRDTNGSIWTMNDVRTQERAVKAVVHGYSIDVNNLCSFMPQDRVGAFSQFNPKEILQNTLKSIRSPTDERNLFEEQKELSNLEQQREKFRQDRDTLQKKFDDSKRELDSLAGELDRLKRREEALEKQKLLKVKLLFLEIDELMSDQTQLREQSDAAVTRLNERKDDLPVVEKKLAKLKKMQAEIMRGDGTSSSGSGSGSGNQHKATTDAFNKLSEMLNRDDEKIEDSHSNVTTLLQRRKTAEEKVRKLNKDAKDCQENIDRAESQREIILAQVQEITQRIRQVIDEAKEVDEQILTQRAKVNEKRDEVGRLTREAESMTDARQVYIRRLQDMGSDRNADHAIKAYAWLQKELPGLKASGRIRGEVYGPIGMLCSAKDKIFAAMIEKVIPVNRLTSFIVEYDEDAALLKAEFRTKRGWWIDLLTMKSMLSLNKPRVYSQAQLESFRAIGMQGYLSEQIECPDIVRACLYTWTTLPYVLWGQSEVEMKQAQLNGFCVPGVEQFRVFMYNPSGAGSILEFTGKKSRYLPSTALPSIASFSVGQPRGWVGIGDAVSSSATGGGGGDGGDRRREMQERIIAAKRDQDQLAQELTTLQQSLSSLQTEQSSKQRLKTDLTQRMNEAAVYRRRLAEVEKARTNTLELLANDAATERQEQCDKYIKAVDKVLSHLREKVLLKMSPAFDTMSHRAISQLKQFTLRSGIEDLEEQLTSLTFELKELEKEVAVKMNRVLEVERRINKKNTDLAVFEKEYGQDRLVKEVFPAAQEMCPSNDCGVVQDMLIEITAMIDNIDDNPNLLRRQQELTRLMTELTVQLENSQAQHANAEETLQQQREEWLSSVKAIANRLHITFKTYMQELGFDGEVLLRETGGFLDYELALMVAFRSGANVTQLSAQKHSGGERAVSTIMFLMSLQDMTQSPFRVVDEINQGMDERNERLVLDRIVRNCCDSIRDDHDHSNSGETAATAISSPSRGAAASSQLMIDGSSGKAGKGSKPQYFLITPKLLPSLLSINNPDVTVLIVRSGAGLRNADWSFANVIDTYLAQMRLTDGSGKQKEGGSSGSMKKKRSRDMDSEEDEDDE